MAKKAARRTKPVYDNESISALKGADRVRKRPAVIFGSDGLEGCQHAVFEIFSNAIDEAREGGNRVVTRYNDLGGDYRRGPGYPGGLQSARAAPIRVFANSMQAASLTTPRRVRATAFPGAQRPGLCATQYASRYGWKYMGTTPSTSCAERGEIVGGL